MEPGELFGWVGLGGGELYKTCIDNWEGGFCVCMFVWQRTEREKRVDYFLLLTLYLFLMPVMIMSVFMGGGFIGWGFLGGGGFIIPPLGV